MIVGHHYLVPLGTDRLGSAGGAQDREFERGRAHTGLLAQRLHESMDFPKRQRRVMYDLLHLRRFREQMIEVTLPTRGVLAGPVSVDFRPIEDCFDAAAYSYGCLVRYRPYGFKDAHDHARVDILNRDRSDDRISVNLERLCPLVGVLQVLPTGAV